MPLRGAAARGRRRGPFQLLFEIPARLAQASPQPLLDVQLVAASLPQRRILLRRVGLLEGRTEPSATAIAVGDAARPVTE